MIPRKKIYELIDLERARQVKIHGDHAKTSNFEWASIAGEEFGEACESVNKGDHVNLRNEVLQFVTVGVAWLESMSNDGIEKLEAKLKDGGGKANGMSAKFKRKDIFVQAIRYMGDDENKKHILNFIPADAGEFMQDGRFRVFGSLGKNSVDVGTFAQIGDWIVLDGIYGGFIACTHDIFLKLYKEE